MRGAGIGIFIILVVIGATISGCLGSADNAGKEKTTGRQLRQTQTFQRQATLTSRRICSGSK